MPIHQAVFSVPIKSLFFLLVDRRISSVYRIVRSVDRPFQNSENLVPPEKQLIHQTHNILNIFSGPKHSDISQTQDLL